MCLRRLLVRLALPLLVPPVAWWVWRQERRILAEGVALTSAQLADARALGVRAPERVRLLCLPRIPLPGQWLVRCFGGWTGALLQDPDGMSMRHGIYLREPHGGDRRLLLHELAHTRQYERLGGLRSFLRRYLRECLTDGYHAAAMEAEAIAESDRLCR